MGRECLLRFNTLLLRYYETGEKEELKDFLYTNAIQGIQVTAEKAVRSAGLRAVPENQSPERTVQELPLGEAGSPRGRV